MSCKLKTLSRHVSKHKNTPNNNLCLILFLFFKLLNSSFSLMKNLDDEYANIKFHSWTQDVSYFTE